jgi:hypothetical protein
MTDTLRGFDAARERLQAAAGDMRDDGGPEPDPEATQPEPLEPKGKADVTYVVLLQVGFDTVTWEALGSISAPSKAAAWEEASAVYERIRADGAQTQLVPARFWKPVTTRERVWEPEFVPEGL